MDLSLKTVINLIGDVLLTIKLTEIYCVLSGLFSLLNTAVKARCQYVAAVLR